MPYEALTSVQYTTSATATNGRDGSVTSEDGVIDLALGRPGSKANPKANPETLFASGYAACFGSAVIAVGRQRGLDLSDATVTAEVSLGPTDSGFGLAVAIVADLPGVDHDVAVEIVEAAHQGCPYSKATRGNIEVTVTTAG